MAELERLQPEGVVQPFAHYSTVTKTSDRMYVAGLVSVDADGTLLGEGSPGEQMRNICNALKSICEQNGVTLANVAQCTVYLTDASYYREADAAFAEVFGENKPARATVVCKLVSEDFLVEVVSVVEL
jgi:2-iminobutanoate/2-iminopropanoate deaminase